MLKYFRQALDFLLFSNIFIALCALAQCLVTYQLIGAQPEMHVLALIFCSTLALYNFSILLTKPASARLSPSRRVRWIFSHYRLTITLTIVSILSIIPLFLFLHTVGKILLISLAVTSVAYNLPLFSIDDRRFGIRNIPGLKLFLIAIIWSLSCVLLPILELEHGISSSVTLRETILLVAKRFLFIAAITVPFDIRDLFQDRTNELKTIPVMWGESGALLFCQFLLAGYLALLFLFTTSPDAHFLALLATIVLTSWLIFRSKWEKDEYYYFLYLDGTMILQCLMLYICTVFFS